MKIYTKIVFVAVAVVLFLCLPYALQSTSDKPVQADAIVILGGGGEERTLTAYQLSKEGYSQNFLLTGSEENWDSSTAQILDPRARWLTLHGVPPTSIFFVNQSYNSWLEANRTLEIMSRR